LFELGHPRTFLFNHRNRRAGHKTLVAQLGFGLGDFTQQAGYFFAQPRGLGSHVNLNMQCQAQAAHHGHRCRGRGRRKRGFIAEFPQV